MGLRYRMDLSLTAGIEISGSFRIYVDLEYLENEIKVLLKFTLLKHPQYVCI